jgi:hypothetical protein
MSLARAAIVLVLGAALLVTAGCARNRTTSATADPAQNGELPKDHPHHDEQPK